MPTSTKSPYSLQSDYNHTCSVQGSTSCIGNVDLSMPNEVDTHLRLPQAYSDSYQIHKPIDTIQSLILSILLMARIADTKWYRERHVTLTFNLSQNADIN